MKPCTVYKETEESWSPSFCMEDKLLVEVSFLKLNGSEGWRVCVWGMDDCGMEKDFDKNQENSAWCCFIELIGRDLIDMQYLKSAGFTSS